jgi:hypothetical protein
MAEHLVLCILFTPLIKIANLSQVGYVCPKYNKYPSMVMYPLNCPANSHFAGRCPLYTHDSLP